MLESLLPQLDRDLVDEARVFLVDDGSSDGTGAMASSMSDAIEVITGDGSLFYAGGMAQAHRAARAWQPDLIWLVNDDVVFDADALERLLEAKATVERLGRPAIINGALREPWGDVSYTGLDVEVRRLSYRFRRVPGSDLPKPCATVSGNCVLLDAAILDGVRPFDLFGHWGADVYLGLEATRQGTACFVAPGTVGDCELHWMAHLDPFRSLRQRITVARSRLGPTYAEELRIARLVSPRRARLLASEQFLRILMPSKEHTLKQLRRIPRRAARLIRSLRPGEQTPTELERR